MIFIIVPFYNSKKFLSDCINSINNQLINNIFTIFVDDGSTDDGSVLINKCATKHKLLIKKNGGPSSARNFALEYIFKNFEITRDDFITFLDADDMLNNHFIERYIGLINDTSADIVCGKTYTYQEPVLLNNFHQELNSVEAIKKLLKNEIFSFSCVKLYRAFLWQDIRFPEYLSLYEDVATIYKTFIKAKKIVTINDRLYFYRENNESFVRSKLNNKKLLSMINASHIRFNDIKNWSSDNEILEENKKFLCLTFLNAFSKIDVKKDDGNLKQSYLAICSIMECLKDYKTPNFKYSFKKIIVYCKFRAFSKLFKQTI